MNDMLAKMQELDTRRRAVMEKIADQLRALIPVLKDHNLTNTAKPWEELLFELDALTGEMRNVIGSDPGEFIRQLSESMRRKP